jgi:tetratricopeptide (TPR) repeat protein
MLYHLRNSFFVALLAFAICFAPLIATARTTHKIVPTHTATGARESAMTNLAAVPTADAQKSLEQARTLIRINKADQAFVELDVAMRAFTSASNQAGIAAVEDAKGDIYTRSGQYKVALTHYTNALNSFRSAGDAPNANAVLAKIGQTHFLLGDNASASRAFAEMKVEPPVDDKSKSGSPVVANAGGVARGAGASAASCFMPKNLANNASSSSNPPNMGRAPQTSGGVGRMDLRITDAEGNPLKGIRAQIKSTRPGGLFCECFQSSDAIGRALMPPLHIADKIKLVLKGNGYPTQELALSAQDIAQPVRVVMTKAGAQIASSVSQAVVNPCFDLYRAFVAYGTSQLGAARGELKANKQDAARARYENLLASLALPGVTNLGQVSRFRAAARTALGDIAFKEARFADAIKLYTEASVAARADNRLDLLWAAERGSGRTLLRQAAQSNDAAQVASLRGEAIKHYRESLKAIEIIRDGSLRADDARTLFLASTKDVFDEASAALIEMALAANASSTAASKARDAATTSVELKGYPLQLAAEAFKIIEQGRARSLLDLLGEARADITEGIDPEMLKRKNEITARQAQIMHQLSGVAMASEKPSTSPQELDAELEQLAIAYDGLENTIRTRSTRYAALVGAQPRTLAEIQQGVLDDKTLLLSYQLGAEKSYAWAITRGAVNITVLPPRANIETLATNLRAQLIPIGLRRSIVGIDVVQTNVTTSRAASAAAPDVNSYAAASHELYRTILQPFVSLLTDKRLLVVADGALNYVPFEALVTAQVATADSHYGSLPYLVKTNEVIYAPSASVVAAVRSQAAQSRAARAASTSRGSMLVVADPVFDAKDERAKSMTVAASGAGESNTRGLVLTSAISDVAGVAASMNLVRLLGTRDEANSIAELARAGNSTADVWLDLEASEAKLIGRDMSNYRVMHFATHGLLMPSVRSSRASCFHLSAKRIPTGFCAPTRFSTSNLARRW